MKECCRTELEVGKNGILTFRNMLSDASVLFYMSWSVLDSIQYAYQKILEICNSAFSAVNKLCLRILHHEIYSSNVQINF